MDLFNRVSKIRPKVNASEFELRDEGKGPYISRWDSSEAKPTDAEIASADDSKPTWVVAQDEIEKLESEITIRRIREAFTDPTWMKAQEAKIAIERTKLSKE